MRYIESSREPEAEDQEHGAGGTGNDGYAEPQMTDAEEAGELLAALQNSFPADTVNALEDALRNAPSDEDSKQFATELDELNAPPAARGHRNDHHDDDHDHRRPSRTVISPTRTRHSNMPLRPPSPPAGAH